MDTCLSIGVVILWKFWKFLADKKLLNVTLSKGTQGLKNSLDNIANKHKLQDSMLIVNKRQENQLFW